MDVFTATSAYKPRSDWLVMEMLLTIEDETAVKWKIDIHSHWLGFAYYVGVHWLFDSGDRHEMLQKEIFGQA